MAYTGFVSSPKYTMSDRAETIEGNWTFGKNGSEQFQANGTWTFNKTIQGTALNALWGDLAEIYECHPDAALVPGTVVKLGGKYEITKTQKNDRHAFGVISTKPGVVLNKKELKGQKIALVGRVPVRVIGQINKFDKLTTSYVPGIAKKKTWLDTLLLKPTIGVALKTNTNENEKLVESAVKIKI